MTLKGAVREVLATEMLEALGVYTSKTFSVFETGERLQRNDEPSPTRSGVMVRLSHSHIRFGSFQRHAFSRRNDLLQQWERQRRAKVEARQLEQRQAELAAFTFKPTVLSSNSSPSGPRGTSQVCANAAPFEKDFPQY